MKKVYLFAAAILLVCGCRKAPALHVVAAPSKLPQGWTETKSRDGSVSLGVAPGWRMGADRMSDDMNLGSLGAAASSTPTDSSAASQQQDFAADIKKQDDAQEQKSLANLEKKGIVIQIINSSKPVFDEARTRYYVLRKHTDGNPGWAEATDFERKHYAFPPKPEEVTLPIGKSYRLSADDTLRNGSVRHEISYLAIEGHDIYVLRFVTQEDGSVIKSIADQVAQTWRIKPGASTE